MADNSGNYSGSLRPKKKADLLAIANDLGMQDASNSQTKADLEAGIRTFLRSHPRYQKDPKYADLWRSISDGESRRSSRRTDHADSDDSNSPPVKSNKRESQAAEDDETPSRRALRKVGEAGQAVAHSVAAQVTEVAQNTAELAQNTASNVVEQVTDPENRQELILAADHTAREYSNALVKFTARSIHEIKPTLRKHLSSAWAIIGVTLLIELAFIVSTTVPYSHRIQMEPWKWIFFQFTPDHPWSVTLPDLAVLYQFSFVRVIFTWLFSSVLLPFLAASLVVFPRSKHYEGASPLTFSIVRLALDFYLAKLAPSPLFDWSNSVVQRFGDVQLLNAATAAAFSFYQIVAEK